MPLRLFLLFTLVPVLELALLIKIGTHIGVGPTVAVVILTGFAGAILAKHQGFKALNSIKSQLQDGIIPADELLSGAFVLAGALLLLTPGFVTDTLGLCCLVPPTRRLMKIPVKKWLKRHIDVHFDSPDGF
ncbi:FxsA family protein [bacterium]|nr:FxsA family protein [bacterium]